MNNELIQKVESVFKLPYKELYKSFEHIKEVDAYHFWNPIKDGISLLIDKKGKTLVVKIALSMRETLNVFKEQKDMFKTIGL